VVPLVLEDLRRLTARAEADGIRAERIVLDPGFGFGKRLDENFPLLARFGELHQLGFPLLSGTSRKSFTGDVVRDGRAAPTDRLPGTLATVTAAILQGSHVVRVHEVRSTVQAVRIADSILRARASPAQVITA
jgi:dihydropteroate synthase